MRLDILAVLKSERDRLDRAILALEGGIVRRGTRRRAIALGVAAARIRRRRRMSAASRRKISEMMKKRWAERKKGKVA